jgi:hypothetical protein
VAVRERFATLASEWRKRGDDLGLGMGVATGGSATQPVPAKFCSASERTRRLRIVSQPSQCKSFS